MAGYFRSKFDRDGKSSEMGEQAEVGIVKIAKAKGYHVTKSSNWEDAVAHFDYTFVTKTLKYKIEVKARKRLFRAANEAQDEWIWVEFKNVNGNHGWIYGKADKVAFELDESYIIVNRKDLAELAEKLVDRENIVLKSSEAKYKAYRRKDRPKELVGLIHINDLKTIKHIFWRKI